MRLAAIPVLLIALASVTSAQTLKHFPVPPQYKDQKVLNHLADLQNQLRALRASELKVSFNGWSSPDVQAAAEKHSGHNFAIIEKTISDIDDIRANSSYSIRDLFFVYAGSQSIEGTAVSLANQVFEYKHDGQVGAEILGASDEIMFSMSDLEQDIVSALDFQGDVLMTLQAEQPSKQ